MSSLRWTVRSAWGQPEATAAMDLSLIHICFCTAGGEFLEEKELNEEQREWLRKYEVLNYCGMVDLFDEARPMFCLN